MTQTQLVLFSLIIALLILLSAFFSSSETALMAVNRYRLRHKARLKVRYAELILKLLKRPDRLLGMILIGNCLANIIAATLCTYIAEHKFGGTGVIIATTILTFVILIFAEVAPKTVAALYPEAVSRVFSYPIYFLLIIFYPFVWFINFISNGLLKLFGMKQSSRITETLSREELRSVVYDTSGRMAVEYQSMLLGILDLNKVTVDDVVIPEHEIYGIDIDEDWEAIKNKLAKSPHDWLPVYHENINKVIGIVHLRDLNRFFLKGKILDKAMLMKKIYDPYFIPEGTPLNIQLVNFQRLRKRIALVVNEYGEVQGIVTLEDILEEIVGEFTTGGAPNYKIELQKDGSYLVDGSVSLRELNRVSNFNFPTDGPRTLNGLVVEHLEALPMAGIGIRIGGHPVEVMEVKENRVTLAKIFPNFE